MMKKQAKIGCVIIAAGTALGACGRLVHPRGSDGGVGGMVSSGGDGGGGPGAGGAEPSGGAGGEGGAAPGGAHFGGDGFQEGGSAGATTIGTVR